MKARPILMHATSIQSLLAGRKTQTRRIVKWPKRSPVIDTILSWTIGGRKFGRCPYGAPGDYLYVREAWRVGVGYDSLPGSAFVSPTIGYEADGGARSPHTGRYRHARFMPCWASRLTLRLNDVRVERVQDCSVFDALEEGVEQSAEGWTPLEAFQKLWNDTNGPGAWERNEWTWALTFEVVNKNVDAVLAPIKGAA